MCDSYPPKNSFIQFNLSICVFGNYLLVMLQAAGTAYAGARKWGCFLLSGGLVSRGT